MSAKTMLVAGKDVPRFPTVWPPCQSTGIATSEERKSQTGFSLIELIVVLVILGLLASVVTPQIIKWVNPSKHEIAKIQIKELEGALEMFAFKQGRYPNTTEGLEALIRNPGSFEAWDGPYLKKASLPLDPWGRSYVYRSPGQHGDFDLLSYGPDHVEGGEGDNEDVTSWN